MIDDFGEVGTAVRDIDQKWFEIESRWEKTRFLIDAFARAIEHDFLRLFE